MLRLDNHSTITAAGSVANRTRQLKFCWSISYEFDWRKDLSEGVNQKGSQCGKVHADALGAMLDQALAYAG